MREYYLPWFLPILFTVALVFHYVGAALDYLTPEPSALVDIGPLGRQMPPPTPADPAETEPEPIETQPASQPRAPRSQAAKAAERSGATTSRPAGPERPDVHRTTEALAANGPSQIVVVGDEDGIHKHERALPAAPAPPAADPKPQLPTAAQLGEMEFHIDASPGSIEDLVRNVDGAFMRGTRLYDVHGNPLASTARFTSGSKLIVFYALDGGLSVVLPNRVVDEVLQRVALKSGNGTLRRVRVLARFDPSGVLRDVDVL
ncbi:MAG: hypothetical protein HY657_09485 [Acidobacteria bacterium]|nr:hypothetical protein [Acidobacteriota bacterium]